MGRANASRLVARAAAAAVRRSLGSHCSPAASSGPVQGRKAWEQQIRQWGSSAAVATADEPEEEIVFPREGPGVSYALNWALAAAGVPPSGEAYRNLKDAELKKHGAIVPEAKSGAGVFVAGNRAAGAVEITKGQFSRLHKEVTSHLGSASKLYVHDGAVGSSPISDAKIRTIADDPSVSLYLRSILLPTPTRVVSFEAFPITVLAASHYRSQSLGQLGLPEKAEFIAADFETSTALLVGSDYSDSRAVKTVLSALAGPAILDRGAVPLAARLLVQGDTTILLFAPEDIVQSSPSLLKAAVSKDLGVAWSSDGVARLFEPSSERPNVYKNPASVVILTADSSGAVPSVSKVQQSQAAYHFLAGYNGSSFSPAYQLGPASVDAVTLAEKFLSQLVSSGASPFLVNAYEGDKVLPDAELFKLVTSTASEKLPKSKGKKPSEAAVEALKKKYNDFVSTAFPNLPEGIAL